MVRHKNRYLLFHVHWFTPALSAGHGSGVHLPRAGILTTANEEMHILPNTTAMERVGVHTLHAGHIIKPIRDAVLLEMGDLGIGSTSAMNGTKSQLFFIVLALPKREEMSDEREGAAYHS